MNPTMRARIVAQNDTGRGFDEVKRDAVATANIIEASSRRAATGIAVQNSALAGMVTTSRMAAMQQRNLVFQLNDVGVSLASGMNPMMVFIQQGSQIAQIYGQEEGGVGRALKETGNLAVSLVTKFWPITAAVGLGTAALAGMTGEINKAGKEQVTFGQVARASWEVFSEGVYRFVKPAIDSVAGWMGDLWNTVSPSVMLLGNGLIGTFVGAFDSSKLAWSAFPQVMGDIALTTANNVIGGVESMVNGAISLLNDFKGFADEAMGGILPDGQIGKLSFGGIDNPFEGAMGGLAEGVVGAMGNAMNVDYLGGFFDAVKEKALGFASASEEAAKGVDKVGKAHKEGKTWASEFWDNAIAKAEKSKEAMNGFAGEASSLLGQIFDESKEVAIAQAVLSAGEGIAKTMGAYPFPFNLAMAALHAGAAVAQISKIASTNRNSTSYGGGVPSAGAVPAAAGGGEGGGRSVFLTIKGESFSRAQVEQLAAAFVDYQRDGGKLVVN